MNYRFQNLLGAPYRGGNAVLSQNTKLISPVGNRVSVTDLIKSKTVTLPVESSSNICRIAVSPDGTFLLTVDENQRCHFINLHCHVVLHRVRFKYPVNAILFSPNGKYIAVGTGKLVQIWRSPGFKKEVFAFELIRTLADCNDKVTALNWSPDSNYLLVGSKDLAVRLFYVKEKLKGIHTNKPFLLLGHRDSVVGCFFSVDKKTDKVNRIYTIARDCYMFSWGFSGNDGKIDETMEDSEPPSPGTPEMEREEVGAPSKVTACDYHRGLDMVVVGFSNGVFGLYQMPDFVCIHLLSISREKITTAVFNELGNWLVFGCAKLGQLLVWEWRSESYILKQQGHYFDVNCLAYSPDSQLLATGADDNKVKFVSLASDQSGEVICAGTLDSFEIFVWSMKTGRLLDILSGHEGPVHGLVFSPTNATLASSSWDKTVRLWNVFEGKGSVESFPHTHDVLTVVYRPDGRQLACSTLDGQIHFWDPLNGELMYTIEGRRDISGGRLMTDRRSAANSSSGKCFTTLCYSADGSYILAGGSSKYICMYDVADQVLLRRFQITHNLSLDGVIDFLNSKNMTEAGPMDLIDDDNSDTEEGVEKQTRGKLDYDLPGALPNHGRPTIRTKCLKIAPTGRNFVAATTEGVLVYSIDESFIFDPTDLDIDVTPEAVDAALNEDQPNRALILSLRLNEDNLIKKCIFAISPVDIPAVASSIPYRYMQRLIEALSDLLESCPHLEFMLRWCQELCKTHGNTIQQNSRNLLPSLKSLQKSITRIHQDLADTCSSNEYMLQYLCSVGAKK
ncbi:hypothetical protein CUMW_199080 [Citrus unshiu]|nr:hypothetical protein CUMW_199080 [Citrus unshiu]